MQFSKQKLNNRYILFDENFPKNEQLPRRLSLVFTQIKDNNRAAVIINQRLRGGKSQMFGDKLTDNSYQDDGYRYHDIFHLTHAAILGWSPVLRKLLKVKRKSNPIIDEVEDGSRACITEECISILIFQYAKEVNFFAGINYLDLDLYRNIKRLTFGLEVRNCTYEQWQQVILQGYRVYRLIRKNGDGVVHIDMLKRKISYSRLPNTYPTNYSRFLPNI